MNLGLLFLLLGVGAVFAFGDFFNSSNSDEETEDEGDNIRTGTDEADLIFTDGGEIIDGLDGDDTLVSFGDSTLLGGEGDDTLVSVGGGALLNGGTGADLFVIVPLDVSDSGGLLDLDGQPVAPTVIDDFNPDDDQLLIDLRDSSLLPEDATPVLLTGVVAPDGEGLMIQVNGVNVVQLSSYGGGDMQSALEDLVNLDNAIEIVGADFVFPSDGLRTPDGVEIVENPDGSLSFAITDAYSGGGELVGVGGIADVLDLSQFSGNTSIFEDDEGYIYLRIEGDDVEPTLLTNVTSVTLGSGENVVNVGSVPGGFTVTATDGTNTISAWRGILNVNLGGGTNTVLMSESGTVFAEISGGENTIAPDEDVFTQIAFSENAGGVTTVSGGNLANSLNFRGDNPSLEVVLTESGGAMATWEDGSLQMDFVGSVVVGNGATVDASAVDAGFIPQISAAGPDATIIGSQGTDHLFGQGNFSGGGGDDLIGVFATVDGGASANGGAGDDTLIADLSDDHAGDIVMTGGTGQDTFSVLVNADTFTGDGGIARITDLEEDENAFLRIFYSEDGAEPTVTTESDAEANEVRVLVNGTLVLIIENTSELLPGMLIPFTTPIPAPADGIAA